MRGGRGHRCWGDRIGGGDLGKGRSHSSKCSCRTTTRALRGAVHGVRHWHGGGRRRQRHLHRPLHQIERPIRRGWGGRRVSTGHNFGSRRNNGRLRISRHRRCLNDNGRRRRGRGRATKSGGHHRTLRGGRRVPPLILPEPLGLVGLSDHRPDRHRQPAEVAPGAYDRPHRPDNAAYSDLAAWAALPRPALWPSPPAAFPCAGCCDCCIGCEGD